MIGSFEGGHGDRVAALYEPLGAPIVRTTVPTAEMVKYASNAFLATKISFINEIANVCEEVGADVAVVADGMGRTRASATPSCAPASASAGAASPRTSPRSSSSRATRGYHFQLLTSVIEVNELQKRRVIGKLKKHLGTLEGKRVALLGLAFKPETDDMREASSLVLAARLLAEGAQVCAFDPIVDISTDRLKGVRCARARRRRSQARTPPCSSPSGRRSSASTGRPRTARCAHP